VQVYNVSKASVEEVFRKEQELLLNVKQEDKKENPKSKRDTPKRKLSGVLTQKMPSNLKVKETRREVREEETPLKKRGRPKKVEYSGKKRGRPSKDDGLLKKKPREETQGKKVGRPKNSTITKDKVLLKRKEVVRDRKSLRLSLAQKRRKKEGLRAELKRKLELEKAKRMDRAKKRRHSEGAVADGEKKRKVISQK